MIAWNPPKLSSPYPFDALKIAVIWLDDSATFHNVASSIDPSKNRPAKTALAPMVNIPVLAECLPGVLLATCLPSQKILRIFAVVSNSAEIICQPVRLLGLKLVLVLLSV